MAWRGFLRQHGINNRCLFCLGNRHCFSFHEGFGSFFRRRRTKPLLFSELVRDQVKHLVGVRAHVFPLSRSRCFSAASSNCWNFFLTTDLDTSKWLRVLPHSRMSRAASMLPPVAT